MRLYMELSGAKKNWQMSMYNGHIHSNIDRVQYIKTILKLRGLLEIKLFFTLTSYRLLQKSFLKVDYLLTKIENKMNTNQTTFIKFSPQI